ncbi:MAG: DNA polymerase I [Candidatus Promineifilaceae bacterium]
MTSKKLVLIDGHALAYRVFSALPLDSFTTQTGEPTNATFGFVRTLLDIIQADDPPHYLAVSFDLGATFRDALFAEYKGTREKMPDELNVQIERIKEVVAAFNIPILAVEGYEADDVLGTIARQAKEQGVRVEIITGDRDLLQLVDDNTIVELPPGRYERLPQRYDVDAVLAKFDVPPPRIVDYKALVGDASDNIPGVKGIGDKTARKLLQMYETLDGIYAHLDEIKGTLGQKLAEGKENAYLSYKLATIITDAPIKLDLDACVAHEFDPEPVLALFQTLEFRSLTKRLLQVAEKMAAMPGPETTQTETVVVRTAGDLQKLAAALNNAQVIAFDVETTGVDKMAADLVGISLATKPGVGYYIPVGHIVGEAQAESGQLGLFAGTAQLAPDQLPLKTVLTALRPALTNPQIAKVAHNAKFDYTILARYGLVVTPITFDTMLAEWLINPASRFLELKEQASQYLSIKMTEISDLIGHGRKEITFAQVPIEQAAPYAAADADITLRMKQKLEPEVKSLGLEHLLTAVEMPLVPVLSDMEQIGVGVDVAVFKQMSRELEMRLAELEGEIYKIAGKPFNINSTQQLSDVLFKELNLPHEKLRRTQSGHYSTASDVLQSLEAADETGITRLILEHRELAKLKSTYVDALPEMVNPHTGRIHTSFNQTGSVTGRLASNSPNLQNIPIRTEVGRQIRRGFVARPGWMLLAADYSQVELRILAHVCKDAALIEAFRQGQDIHRTTAAAVYGIPIEEVKFEQRRFAKAVNFGLIYGMGAFRLSRDSELTLAEAEDFIKVYFQRFPGINRYLEQTKRMAHEQGYVETLLGRRRYFPVFKVRGGVNRDVIARAEREAINHPIQGSAADIIKIAMIRLHQALMEQFQGRMILQVHDELLLEVPEAELDPVRDLVVDIMSNAYAMDVPLKVETGSGYNWLEIKA